MKKLGKSLPLLLCIVLLGACQNQQTSSSSAATSSAPEAGTPEFYVEAMKNNNVYYSISLRYTIKKGSDTYESGSIRKFINLTDKIEELTSSVMTLASLSTASATTTTYSSSYICADRVYTYNSEDKSYHITYATRSEFKTYTFDYDFSAGSNLSVTFDKSEAILSGSVTSDKLTDFGASSLSGVTDFTFQLTLNKTTGLLSEALYTYTKDGFSVSKHYVLTTIEQSISLPE
jgi:hypothetical protein